ncbi:class III extradiol dioxygenase subunit B-like domain-containing protein [Streptomyces sp. 6N223]|uniref:class III extradiol dioxygenase subunit B-like domain-containing protein n=1 Tax=Streptomyces sp. 6N223 TaxID=3457412 RepID=UPI003FCFF510
MLVAAAVCPCPPLLVPEVAAGAAPEMDAARAACLDALGVLAAARPDRLVVAGPAEPEGRGPFPAGTRGSFHGFGVDVEVALGHGEAGERPLPPSLTVGAWLLTRAGWDAAPAEGLGVGEPLEPERCAAAGRALAAGTGRLALLVMGDGSACRSPGAPGSFDERAAAFDAEAARALGEADTAGLAALDAGLAEELKASGRSCWQLLGGAGAGAGLGGRLLFDQAPYGVGYLVASWS